MKRKGINFQTHYKTISEYMIGQEKVGGDRSRDEGRRKRWMGWNRVDRAGDTTKVDK